MNKSLGGELRYLFPAWVLCVLLPMPLFVFRHWSAARSYELLCFALGCAILAAYSFRRDIKPPGQWPGASDAEAQTWRERTLPLGLALLGASAMFSLLSLAINNAHDFVAPMLAFMVIIPALGIVPYMVLATRRSLGGILFSMILVGSLKSPIGALIVHTFFRSHFVQATDADGTLIMPTPWAHPNMLVWWLYMSTAAFSLLFYFLGAKKFRTIHEQPA